MSMLCNIKKKNQKKMIVQSHDDDFKFSGNSPWSCIGKRSLILGHLGSNLQLSLGFVWDDLRIGRFGIGINSQLLAVNNTIDGKSGSMYLNESRMTLTNKLSVFGHSFVIPSLIAQNRKSLTRQPAIAEFRENFTEELCSDWEKLVNLVQEKWINFKGLGTEGY
jgi:hypothetical protein